MRLPEGSRTEETVRRPVVVLAAGWPLCPGWCPHRGRPLHWSRPRHSTYPVPAPHSGGKCPDRGPLLRSALDNHRQLWGWNIRGVGPNMYSVKNTFQCDKVVLSLFDLQKATKIKFEATIKVALNFHSSNINDKTFPKTKEAMIFSVDNQTIWWYNANPSSFSIIQFSTS